eukprot:Gregarina_sp_Poly_1__11517@NODE_999_length_5423_cov_682_617625_g701_i0_p8_GENE_NODE_999_length_5423_cov_682_617625_g701_i0NODE_999_length_5423_cov_682_617625_g701_i0_p8_ORF_typecomplete_len129_score2_84_NODE_999_length_5423_cov_682_617625_g701_i0534920
MKHCSMIADREQGPHIAMPLVSSRCDENISDFSWGICTPMIRARDGRRQMVLGKVNDGRSSMMINMILWMCFLINLSFIFMDRFAADSFYDIERTLDLVLPFDDAYSFWLLIYVIEFISLVNSYYITP